MAGKKSGDGASVVDGLKNIYQELASLQLAPDAQEHMQVLQALQKAIQGYLQQQMQKKAQMAAQQQMQVAHAANPQMGGPPPGGPSAGGPPPGAPPGGPGGPPSQGSPGLAMPNPDEMRRMLATQGAGG